MEKKEDLDVDIQLCSLADSIATETHGNFLVISSSTAGTYNFYIQDGTDGYHLHSIPAKNTTVRLEDGQHRLVCHVRATQYAVDKINEATNDEELFQLIDRYQAQYTIYASPGTIVEDFTLDAQ